MRHQLAFLMRPLRRASLDGLAEPAARRPDFGFIAAARGFLDLGRSFFSKATPQCIHQVNYIVGPGHMRDLRRLSRLFRADEIDDCFPILISKLLWLEAGLFRIDDVRSEIKQLLANPEVRNFVEIYTVAAHLIVLMQDRAENSLRSRFEQDQSFAFIQHTTRAIPATPR